MNTINHNEFSKEALINLLPYELKNISINVYETIDSTNTEAIRWLKDNKPSPCIFIAGEQTAGRGRRGRSFYSPKDTGLYISLIWVPNTTDFSDVSITTRAAVAVSEAIEDVTKINTQIKWVNDIYIGKKKIAGILTEGFTNPDSGKIEAVVIGIGINISTSDFPIEIADIAGSLESSVSTVRLAAELSSRLYHALNSNDNMIEAYKIRSNVIGKPIIFYIDQTPIEALAIDIDKNGGLIVELADGKNEILRTGEITLRIGNI